MDKFPEAFERFESDVDVDRFDSYRELIYAFQWWAGEKWIGSHKQWKALNAEAENLGFETPDFLREELEDNRECLQSSWRREILNLRGKARSVYRDIKTGRFIKKP